MSDEIQRWSLTGDEGLSGDSESIEADIESYLRSAYSDAANLPIRCPDDSGVFPIALWPMSGYPVPPVVVDANVLRNDVLYSCRKNRRTSLVTATNLGFLRMFCAEHVIEEVNEHLPRWTREGGVDKLSFVDRWEQEYLPLIRCVDVPNDLLTESEAEALGELGRIDPDDVPSATLARLLGAFYLSEDKRALEVVYGSGLDFEFHHAWLNAIRSGSNSAQITGALQVALIAPALLGEGLFGLGRFLYSKSPWLLAGALVAVGAAGYLAWRSDQDRAKGVLSSAGNVLFTILETVNLFHNYALQCEEAFSRVFPVVPGWEDVGSLRSVEKVLARQCLYSLAREPGGHLSAAQMHEEIPFYVKGQQNAIRKVFREYPCFQEVGRGRWQVGRAICM
ncbi:MAG: PIN domain-containing protein [Ferrimicrobium sp.]